MENKYQFRTLRKLLQKLGVLQVVWFLIALFIGFQLISACSFQREVTLTFAVTQDEVERWNPLIEQFHQKYQNIDIKLNTLPGNVPDGSDKLKEALVSAFNNKKPYDLLYLDIVWVPEFANKDWLMDLTQYFKPQELKSKKEFLLNEIENGCYGGQNGCDDGKLYRVPFRTDIGVLYYRKDLLEQAKIKPPETFSQLKNISQKLQSKLRANQEDFWGYLWPGKGESLVAMFTEVLHGHGGYWIKDKNVGLDQEQAIKAVKFLRDTISDISPPDVTKLREEQLLKKFVDGKAVFMRHWPYVWAKAHESGSKVSGKIGIIPMVHEESKTSGLSKGGWGFGVAKDTTHLKEAIKAIQFFTSAPIQRQFTLSYGSVPSRRVLFFDPKIITKYRDYPRLLNWMDSLVKKGQTTEWIARPRIPQYTQASCILQKYLSEALDPNNNQEKDNEEKAMHKAAEETRKLLLNQEIPKCKIASDN